MWKPRDCAKWSRYISQSHDFQGRYERREKKQERKEHTRGEWKSETKGYCKFIFFINIHIENLKFFFHGSSFATSQLSYKRYIKYVYVYMHYILHYIHTKYSVYIYIMHK